jgi:hypothetical protein
MADGAPGQEIEKLLRALATSEAALKALNGRKNKSRHRELRLNRAVHFHVVEELHSGKAKKSICGLVGDVWCVGEKQVGEDVASCRAKEIMEGVIEQASRTSDGAARTRGEVLRDLDSDLRYRAEILHTRDL